jgi:hypothetical protein
MVARSLNQQHSELSNHSLGWWRLGKRIQQLATRMRCLACNQATKLFDFTLLLDVLSNVTEVLKFIVRVLKN